MNVYIINFLFQVSEPPRWSAPAQLSAARETTDGSSSVVGRAREVVSQAMSLEPPYLAATVVFTVISAMLVCGLVVAVVLYKRHTTGQYPKVKIIYFLI